MNLGVYQNLLALWGIYEKEIERFHEPQRRHPQNSDAISLRFGDGGPADRYRAIRDDTPVGRAAFAREVYTTQSLRELHHLVHSSLAQGNRKVGIPSSSTLEAPGSRVSFRELGNTMVWGKVLIWCTFVCFMVRYAHWLDHKDFSFFMYGLTDIEDLLELINVPRRTRTSFKNTCQSAEEVELARQRVRAQGQEESSQGGPRDMPPDHWIRRELETFNALCVPGHPSSHDASTQDHYPVGAPNLTGDIHPLFRKGAWNTPLEGEDDWTWPTNVEAEQRNSLRQACLLASRLLDFAAPWFESFIPQAGYTKINTANPVTTTIEVSMVEDSSRRTLVHRSLHEIAESVKISFSPDLLPNVGVWSQHNRRMDHGVPGQPVKLHLSEQEHADRDQLEQGTLSYKRRSIQITIASQLRQAALSATAGTQEHLFAVFYLAVVLVSEMGYAAWLTNFNNLFLDGVRYDDDVYPNLRVSLIGWTFGGWFPRPSRLDDNDDNRDGYHHVREGLHWNKLYKRAMQRPLLDTVYSIPVHYIQRILTQDRWEEVDRAEKRRETTTRFLKPDTPFQQRHTARVARRHEPRVGWAEGVRVAKHYEDLDWEVTPPLEWDLVELRATGAVGCSVSPLGLTEILHPIFAYEHWTRAPENYENRKAPGTASLTGDQYDRLRPAMMLATLLLKVGAPWFTSPIPEIKFTSNSPRSQARRVSAPRSYTADEIAAARMQLESMAGHVHFDHNALQLPDGGHLGKCSRGHTGSPGSANYRPSSDNEGNYNYNQECNQEWHKFFDDADSCAKLPYRRMQISVSSQVVRAILDSAEDSERYLQAVYSLAVTLTHEVARAALYANWAWPIMERDPTVRGEAQARIGTSLISWLHGGWIPHDSTVLDENGTATFQYGASWRKWHRVLQQDEYIPRYWTYYSIPISYIQRLFVQAEWDRFDLDMSPELAADALLRPKWPFRAGGHARRVEKTHYRYWSTKGSPDEWYEDDEPAKDDDRVDPYYVDEDWDDGSDPS